MLVHKTLVPERGLKPHEALSGKMAAMIIERGWQEFTQQPEAAVISIVRILCLCHRGSRLHGKSQR